MNRHARTANRQKGLRRTTMTNAEATKTGTVAEHGANTAPAKPTAKKKASTKKGSAKAQRAAKKEAKPASKKASNKDSVPREFSKKAIVLDILRSKDGATMAEIAKATGWQNHSIRGFISGNLTKKMGLTVESKKNETGERVCRIAKQAPSPLHRRSETGGYFCGFSRFISLLHSPPGVMNRHV
jgi:hypothetical protein